MELNELQDIAAKEGLDIYNYKMRKHKGRIIDNCIFMDYSKIETYTEEKCILAEEIRSSYL